MTPDTTLEVLDWGGAGPTLVLPAQLGETAHVYDDWAPTLASAYHVLAITRRGYGSCATTADDFSAERLATDIVPCSIASISGSRCSSTRKRTR